jgi:fucose permease
LNATFRRSPSTWLNYLLLAFYGFMLNCLGPVVPLLKREMGLSYTVASLHFSAFAAGILLVGLTGHRLIHRAGRRRSLWIGAAGMSLGALLLAAGQSPAVTLPAALAMGWVGSLLLVLVPSGLSEEHGGRRAVALSEANVVASLLATAAPLLLGWMAGTAGGWRLGLALAALAPAGLYLGLGRIPLPAGFAPGAAPAPSRPLPGLFWCYWGGIILAVSAEFCMISWCGDFLAAKLGLGPARGAQTLTLFLAGMMLGRLAGSRIVLRLEARRLASASAVLAAAGFLLFWKAGPAAAALAGLFAAGLGIASLYPMLLSLALGACPGQDIQASARATLASGLAILAAPLALGGLADAVGIARAYSAVLALLAGVLLVVWAAGRFRTARRG